ncbi:MAG: hypothetical protein Q7J73_09835 [Dehalococcoidales bacterium]|nr:hypothetical protein [Dehalococcoidales bacterium]
MDQLEFVRSIEDIRRAFITFSNEAGVHQERVGKLARQTIYWVYEARRDKFGANKFVAYKNMTFDRYENALQGNFYGVPFDGHAARQAIEKILEPYEYDSALAERLVRWAESLFGVGILDGISENKWKFAILN